MQQWFEVMIGLRIANEAAPQKPRLPDQPPKVTSGWGSRVAEKGKRENAELQRTQRPMARGAIGAHLSASLRLSVSASLVEAPVFVDADVWVNLGSDIPALQA